MSWEMYWLERLNTVSLGCITRCLWAWCSRSIMNLCMYRYITQYGSTVYIGIAMVFVFPPYIRKFSSCFQFQVKLTFNDLRVQKTKLCIEHFMKLSLSVQVTAKTIFHCLSMLFFLFFFFFFFLLNSCNSKTVVALNVKLDV